MYLHHRHRVLGVASFCTPYDPPRKEFISVHELTNKLPMFSYQVYFNDGDKAQKELDADPELSVKAIIRSDSLKDY